MNIYVEKKLFKPLKRETVLGLQVISVFVSPFPVISVLSNIEIVTADVQNDFPVGLNAIFCVVKCALVNNKLSNRKCM